MQKSLLLVDDEPQLLYALRNFFKSDGYQILIAENGNEALKILAQTPIQVIISDYRMPDMTGFELLSQIKKHFPETIE